VFTKRSEKLESFVGENSHFTGNVETEGTIRIDGLLEGNVQADWVVLGVKATVKGNIIARGIVVGGKIEGNLLAKEVVDVKAQGVISGDIEAGKFLVVEGGVLNGRVSMLTDASNIVEFQQKST
jgi:cytoskeletal protein CcmA (bactofilin family)